MNREYAVVVLVEGDVWRYARMGALITSFAHEATWLPSLAEAREYAKRRATTSKAQRIVFREVGEINEWLEEDE